MEAKIPHFGAPLDMDFIYYIAKWKGNLIFHIMWSYHRMVISSYYHIIVLSWSHFFDKYMNKLGSPSIWQSKECNPYFVKFNLNFMWSFYHLKFMIFSTWKIHLKLLDFLKFQFHFIILSSADFFNMKDSLNLMRLCMKSFHRTHCFSYCSVPFLGHWVQPVGVTFLGTWREASNCLPVNDLSGPALGFQPWHSGVSVESCPASFRRTWGHSLFQSTFAWWHWCLCNLQSLFQHCLLPVAVAAAAATCLLLVGLSTTLAGNCLVLCQRPRRCCCFNLLILKR